VLSHSNDVFVHWIAETETEKLLMNPESPLVFFQTWMAVVGSMVMGVDIVHKRGYFQTGTSTSRMARILIVSALYFLPAAVAWLFVVGFGMRVVAERGHPVSGVVAAVIGTLGCWAIGNLLLGKEIEGARKLPARR